MASMQSADQCFSSPSIPSSSSPPAHLPTILRPSPASLWLIGLLSLGIVLLPPVAQAAALNSYRFGMMQGGGVPQAASAFLGPPIPMIADRRATFRGLQRRDTEKAEDFVRATAGNTNSESEAIVTEEAAASSRIPRANNAKFARKNCFFSPLQCSFYYKSNSNFANMLIRGDEH